jgi:DNA-binding response OmpR family regulator
MPPPLNGILVVAVEDDPDALALLKLILEHAGALVIAVPDAKSGLKILGSLRPTVLVSDMSMATHDGAWLLTEARSAGLLTDIPALVVTALTMTPREVQEAGFDAYLQKPVEPTELCKTVRALAWRAA